MRLTKILSMALAAVLLAGGAAVSATAAPAPQVVPMDPCSLNAGGGANCGGQTGTPGRDPQAQFDPTGWGGECSLLDRTRVPCISDDGWAWNYAYQCYRRDVSDQYPREDPIWRDPDEGLIIDCRPFGETEFETFWVFDLFGTISPAVLAQQLITEMEIPPPGVTMAPDPYQTANQQAAVIGLPMWMWILDPATVTTMEVSESVGDLTVSISAVPDHIEWTMGDGAVFDCPLDAPAFTEEFAGLASPSCGHTYQSTSAGQTDEKYEVVARAYYNVTWTAGNMSGTQEIAPFSTFYVPVVEFQSNR